MRAETDVYIEPKPYSRERRLADKYWEQRSRMLLPTQSLVASSESGRSNAIPVGCRIPLGTLSSS